MSIGTGDQKKVMMLQPFTAKDFAIRNLADRLSDLSHLVYLYPDIPKQAAFGSHYTPVCGKQIFLFKFLILIIQFEIISKYFFMEKFQYHIFTVISYYDNRFAKYCCQWLFEASIGNSSARLG